MSHGIDVTVATITEGTTPEISAVLANLSQVPLPGSALLALTLTYYQEYTQAIINDRNAQNALQANRVTVDAAGVLIWKLSALDTAILNDALETEPHIAHFSYSYSDGVGILIGSLTFRIPVANLVRVP